MAKKFSSDFTSNGAVAVGDKLLIQKLADSTVNYVTVTDLLTNPVIAGLVNITPATGGRGISIGTKGVDYTAGTTSHKAITSIGGTLDTDPASNYLVGVFSRVAGDESAAATDDLGSAWFRTRVDKGATTPAGYSLFGVKSQLRIYSGANTTINNWAAAGLLGVLEVSGATTTFSSGAIAAAVYGNVSLTTTTVIAAGAVVAGVAAISASAAITDTGAAYYGVYVGKSGAVAFDAGLKIAASSCTTGIDIAAATTGLLISGATTTGISITGASTTALSVGTSGAPLALASATARMLASYSTSSFATAGTVTAMTVKQTMTGASAVNAAEVGQFILASAVKLGQWANAVVGKVDLTTAGYSAGIVGVVCAELDFPSGGVTGGSGQYHCFEAEMNLAGTTGGVPKSFLNMNIWGAQKAEFDTDGFIFDIQGVSIGSTKVFQVNNNAASHALRIRVGATSYYMLLSDTSD